MMQWMPAIVGRWLSNRRAGIERTLFHQVDSAHLPVSIVVTSTDFSDKGRLLVDHTADSVGAWPSLSWGPLPDSTRSIAILVEDADSPTPNPFIHLIAWWTASSPGQLRSSDLNARAGASSLLVGRNGMMQRHWMPPDPPPGHGTHRYLFQVYALSQPPATSGLPHRRILAQSLQKYGLAKGVIVGSYERPGTN